MRLVLQYYALGVVILLASCSQKKEIPLQELKAYPSNPESGLWKIYEEGDIKIEMQYKPKDLIIEQNGGLTGSAVWDSVAKELCSYDYFVMRISKNNKEFESNYAGDPSYVNIVNYLSTSMAKDIWLAIGREEIKPTDVMFVPSYGMSHASTVMLVFQSNLYNRKEDFKVVFNDSALGTGRHEFPFKFDALEDIPALER